MAKKYEATCIPGKYAITFDGVDKDKYSHAKDEFFPVIIEWKNFMVYGCSCIDMKSYTIIKNPCMTRKSARKIARDIIAGKIETRHCTYT